VEVAVIQAWWNGQHDEWAQRVHIREEAGRWRVEHVGPRGRLEYVHCANPTQARAEADRFLSRGATWRTVPTSR
jgi:hypothetical protein